MCLNKLSGKLLTDQRYLKFMLKRRTASAGFFSQSGTINKAVYLALAVNIET
ncbi:hypothetical protein [Candidatus Tisiphia endosymbiont of Parasteatoda lunata]|uniref:hypothetical protein n=1 Tax=Candidatus Tisiphia endosymbiont of Parasteatoda lunata TaxID=3066275 RepID=UPI00313D5166